MPSYVLAFGYCLADACTTGYDTYNATQKPVPTAASTMDVMLWQSLASVGIPSMTINLIVRSSRFALARTPMAVPAMTVKWMPTFVGLASIPFIIHPIDTVVDHFMDGTFRSWTGQLLTKEIEERAPPKSTDERNDRMLEGDAMDQHKSIALEETTPGMDRQNDLALFKRSPFCWMFGVWYSSERLTQAQSDNRASTNETNVIVDT